jgi:hypothetical protein
MPAAIHSFGRMSRTGLASLIVTNLFVALQALWHEWLPSLCDGLITES